MPRRREARRKTSNGPEASVGIEFTIRSTVEDRGQALLPVVPGGNRSHDANARLGKGSGQRRFLITVWRPLGNLVDLAPVLATILVALLLGVPVDRARGSPIEDAHARTRHLLDAVAHPGLEQPSAPTAATAREEQPIVAGQDSHTAVDIRDSRLRKALEEALDKAAGATISRADMASLRSFTASSRRIVDLSGLESAVNLTYLNLGNNAISDVSPLSAMTRLARLTLSGNPIYDIAPLARLDALESVYLGHTNVRDLSPLTGLTRLYHLSLAGLEISDLSPLLRMSRLTDLQLDGVTSADLDVISGLTRLEDLELVRSGLVDLSPMASLRTLQNLNVLGNPIKDLSPLSGLARLTHLNANDALVSDLAPLSRLNLSRLSLDRNEISDISALSRQVGMFRLDIAGNAITDISALRRMTRMQWLSMQRNAISDIRALAGLSSLTRLEAWGNEITDLGPLVRNPSLGAGGFVRVFDNPLSDASIHTHVPALRERGVSVLWESHFSSVAWYQAFALGPRDAREALGRDDYFLLVAFRVTDLPFRCEGTFEVDLDVGGTIRRASSGHGVHDNVIVLTYLIREDDYDPDGLSVVPGTFRLVEGDCFHADGSTIRDVRLSGALPTDDPELRVDGSLDMPARVHSVSVAPPAVERTFVRGERIAVRVAFDEPVMVEGLPQLKLRIGSAVRAAALSQVERAALHFEYRVAPGDVDGNGIALPDPLQLVGGRVRDLAGNVLRLDVPPTHDRYVYRVQANVSDMRAPVVADVSVRAWRDRWPVRLPGTLRQKDRLEVRVAFDEYVEVPDAPTLAVGIGAATRQVPVSAVRGNVLQFDYVVRAGDVDSDGITIAAEALALSGDADIRDGSGNVASLDLGGHVVLAGGSYRVRGGGGDVAPKIVSADFVRFTPREGIRGVGAGESIVFVVRYDEPVWVQTLHGSPTADVRVGGETRTFALLDPGGRRHFRQDVAFAYVVQPSDALELEAGRVDAEYTAGRIRLNGARIQDGAGNVADLTWPSGLTQHWWRVDGSLHAPENPEADLARLSYAAFAGNRGPDRSFGHHETIDIPLHFSAPVTVVGEPALAVRIGDAWRQAGYVGGNGGGQLLFRYRVQTDDLGPLRLAATRLDVRGGAILGPDGQTAGLLVGGVPAPDVFGQSYFVNGAREPDTAVPPVAPPTGVEITPGPGELVVSWEPLGSALSGGAAVTGYVVTARPLDGGAELSCSAAAGETSCVIDGPLDATDFSVTVRAANPLGTGYASTAIVAATEPLGGFWRGWRKVLPELVGP